MLAESVSADCRVSQVVRQRVPHQRTLAYCGQTAGWIKIPLGTEEGLSLGDIVLDGDSAPHVKGHSSPLHFWPMFIVAKRLDGSRYHLVRT